MRYVFRPKKGYTALKMLAELTETRRGGGDDAKPRMESQFLRLRQLSGPSITRRKEAGL